MNLASTIVSHILEAFCSEKRLGLQGSVLHKHGLRSSVRRHRLQLDGQDVGGNELHELELVRSVCRRSDLELRNLVTDLMLRSCGLLLCGSLQKLMIRLQLHELELRSRLRRRLDCSHWGCNRNGRGRLNLTD